MTRRKIFKYFATSEEIIRLAVLMYVRFPLSFRNVEDLLHEWVFDVSHETIRYWWHRFGQKFAADIRKRRIEGGHRPTMALRRDVWKTNGEMRYLWRAVDREGEVLMVSRLRCGISDSGVVLSQTDSRPSESIVQITRD